MRTRLYFVLFFMLTSWAVSQENPVEITYEQEKDGYVFKAKNNTSKQYQFTLTITPTNLKGYHQPITKVVPANATIKVTKLYFIPNKRGSFKTNYTYKPYMSASEKLAMENKLKQKTITGTSGLDHGIVVFGIEGCPRCRFTTNYLLENDIDFKYLNTTKNSKQNKLMWKLVKKENPGIKSLQLPVILNHGKIYYNIADLKQTVVNLKP